MNSVYEQYNICIGGVTDLVSELGFEFFDGIMDGV